MNQVPLSGRMIFSDWHGVLSRDPFWTSIRLSATHPLHEQLEAGLAGVFDPARGTASEWMKGFGELTQDFHVHAVWVPSMRSSAPGPSSGKASNQRTP